MVNNYRIDNTLRNELQIFFMNAARLLWYEYSPYVYPVPKNSS